MVKGALVGYAIGAVIIFCVCQCLKLGKEPRQKRAESYTNQTEHSPEAVASQLSGKQPALPLLVGTNELWSLAPNLRLEHGELTVRKLGKDERIHFSEPVSETLLNLKHEEPSGCFLYCVIHVMRAMPSTTRTQPPPG